MEQIFSKGGSEMFPIRGEGMKIHRCKEMNKYCNYLFISESGFRAVFTYYSTKVKLLNSPLLRVLLT